jgi:hypothetical protein
MLWHGFDILCVTQLEQERAGRRRMRRGACGERGVRADEKSVGKRRSGVRAGGRPAPSTDGPDLRPFCVVARSHCGSVSTGPQTAWGRHSGMAARFSPVSTCSEQPFVVDSNLAPGMTTRHRVCSNFGGLTGLEPATGVTGLFHGNDDWRRLTRNRSIDAALGASAASRRRFKQSRFQTFAALLLPRTATWAVGAPAT